MYLACYFAFGYLSKRLLLFFGCVAFFFSKDDVNCGGDECAILSTDDQRCVEKIINIVTEQEVAPSVKSAENCAELWAIQILNPFCKEAK